MNDEKKIINEDKGKNIIESIKQYSKIKKTIAISICLFFFGHLLVYIGLAKGHDIAINLSRPLNASGWSTSEELIKACTYSPIFLGVSLIFISIVFMTIALIEWLRQN